MLGRWALWVEERAEASSQQQSWSGDILYSAQSPHPLQGQGLLTGECGGGVSTRHPETLSKWWGETKRGQGRGVPLP